MARKRSARRSTLGGTKAGLFSPPAARLDVQPANILSLQRLAGNRATSRLLQSDRPEPMLPPLTGSRSRPLVVQRTWVSAAIGERWDTPVNGLQWNRFRTNNGYAYFYEILLRPDGSEYPAQVENWELDSLNGEQLQALAKLGYVPPNDEQEEPPQTGSQGAPSAEEQPGPLAVYEHDKAYIELLMSVIRDAGLQGLCAAWTIDWLLKMNRGGEGGRARYSKEQLTQVARMQEDYVKKELEKGSGRGMDVHLADRHLARRHVGDGKIYCDKEKTGLWNLENIELENGCGYYLEMTEQALIGNSESHGIGIYKDAKGVQVFDQNYGLHIFADLEGVNERYRHWVYDLYDKRGVKMNKWWLYKLVDTKASPLAKQLASTLT